MIVRKNEDYFSDWIEHTNVDGTVTKLLIGTASKEAQLAIKDCFQVNSGESEGKITLEFARLFFRAYVKDWENFLVDETPEGFVKIAPFFDKDKMIDKAQMTEIALLMPDDYFINWWLLISNKLKEIETNKKK